MNGHAVGIGVGAASLGLVAIVVTAALTLPVPDPLVALHPDEVAVGVVELGLDRGAYVGALVYGHSPAAAEALREDVGYWDFGRSDLTPEPARGALCGQARVCLNATAAQPEGFAENLTRLTGALLDDLDAGAVENVRVTMSPTARGGYLVLSLVRVDAAPGAVRDGTLAALGNLTGGLAEACRTRALQEGLPDDCARRYRNYSLAMARDGGLAAFGGLARTNVSVLGPLAFAWARDATNVSLVRAGLPDGVDPAAALAGLGEPPVGGRVFLPTWALVAVGAAVVLAWLVQEAAERTLGNAFVPLPPLVLMAGALLLRRVNEGHPGGPATFAVVFALVGVAWFVAFRVWDATGVQFFSSAATLLTVAAGGAVLVLRLKTGLLGDVDGLVRKLLTNEASSLASDAVDDALTAAFAVAAGCLAVALAASFSAWREARVHLRGERPEDLLRRPLPEMKERLTRLDPARWRGGPAPLSRYGYASLVAAVYEHARRRPGNGWVREALFFRDPAPKAAAEDREKLEWLWQEHCRSARRARRVADLLAPAGSEEVA